MGWEDREDSALLLSETEEERKAGEEGVSVPEFAGMLNEARRGIMGGSLIGQSDMVKFGDDVIDYVKGQDPEEDAAFTKLVDRTVGEAGRKIVGDSELAQATSKLIGENLALTDMIAPAMSSFKRLGIIGKAERLNKDAYQKALDMKSSGATSDEIFKETGVFTSPTDANLRYELDDSQAKFLLEPEVSKIHEKNATYPDIKATKWEGKVLTLGDVLDYPDLYKYYPEAKDIPFGDLPGIFNPTEKRAAFLQPDIDPDNPLGKIMLNGFRLTESGNFNAQAKSDLLHEVQHYVQYRDELSRGGSARSLFPKGFSELQKTVAEDIKYYTDYLRDSGINASSVMSVLISDSGKATKYDIDQLNSALEYIPEHGILEFQKLLQTQKAVNALDTRMFTMYERMGGEIEARLTQSRVDMSAEERLANRPTYMQDPEARAGVLSEEEQKYFAIDAQLAVDELRKAIGMDPRADIPASSHNIKRTSTTTFGKDRKIDPKDLDIDFGAPTQPQPWDVSMSESRSGLMTDEEAIFGTSKLSSRTDDVMEGADPYEAAETTIEDIDAWKAANKVDNRFAQIPEVKLLAEQLRKGDISPEEFRAKAFEISKPTIFTDIPKMPSLKGLLQGLSKDKPAKGIIGLNKSIDDGTRVATRLDIPAYNQYDKWIVSVHAQGGTSGGSVGYAQTAKLENVEFLTKPQQALDIASEKATVNKRTGETKTASKSPFARMEGDWVNHDVKDLLAEAKTYLEDPEWTQVGMNPYRASYFYDKKTMEPLVSAEELIQIGPLVLARNVKKTTPDDPRFAAKNEKGEAITFAKGGLADKQQGLMSEEESVQQ